MRGCGARSNQRACTTAIIFSMCFLYYHQRIPYTHTPHIHTVNFHFSTLIIVSRPLNFSRCNEQALKKKLMLGGFLLLPCSSVTPVSQVKNISFRFHCSFFFYVATKVNVLMARFLRAFLACRLLEKYLTKP